MQRIAELERELGSQQQTIQKADVAITTVLSELSRTARKVPRVHLDDGTLTSQR